MMIYWMLSLKGYNIN